MNVLIVLAHPEPRSFNAALAGRARDVLRQAGHQVEVSDLYALKFNDTGMFLGKRAMVSVTTGTSADTYAPDGIDGDVLDILWPVHNGLLRYSGFEVLRPFVSYLPRRLTPEEREAELDRFAQHVLADVPRLFFHPREDYGPEERLRPGVIARSGFQHNTGT